LVTTANDLFGRRDLDLGGLSLASFVFHLLQLLATLLVKILMLIVIFLSLPFGYKLLATFLVDVILIFVV